MLLVLLLWYFLISIMDYYGILFISIISIITYYCYIYIYVFLFLFLAGCRFLRGFFFTTLLLQYLPSFNMQRYFLKRLVVLCLGTAGKPRCTLRLFKGRSKPQNYGDHYHQTTTEPGKSKKTIQRSDHNPLKNTYCNIARSHPSQTSKTTYQQKAMNRTKPTKLPNATLKSV